MNITLSTKTVLKLCAIFLVGEVKRLNKISPLITKMYESSGQGILIVREVVENAEKVVYGYVPDIIVTPIEISRENVTELPVHKILNIMKTHPTLRNYIDDSGNVISTNTYVDDVREQYYYLQCHTHPEMGDFLVTPSKTDEATRQQLLDYNQIKRLFTFIYNEEFLEEVKNSLFIKNSLFDDDKTSYLKIKKARISAFMADKCSTYITKTESYCHLLGKPAFFESDDLTENNELINITEEEFAFFLDFVDEDPVVYNAYDIVNNQTLYEKYKADKLTKIATIVPANSIKNKTLVDPQFDIIVEETTRITDKFENNFQIFPHILTGGTSGIEFYIEQTTQEDVFAIFNEIAEEMCLLTPPKNVSELADIYLAMHTPEIPVPPKPKEQTKTMFNSPRNNKENPLNIPLKDFVFPRNHEY